jgi:hypothetical protein
MTKHPRFQLFCLLAIVALFVCGQQGFAAEVPHHWHIKIVPHKDGGGGGVISDSQGAAPPAGLYSAGAAFTNTPNYLGANSDGTDLWPCFGTGGTGTAANADCPTLGDPSQAFPSGGVAVGSPQYVWYLALPTTAEASLQPYGCDASTTADATNYCGQTETWYEDWSGDTTDDLTYLLEATQDGAVIADSGTVDFGPNPYGTGAGFDVIIYGDQNFGTDGVATGPNNGNCEADYNYPSTTDPFDFADLGLFVIQANKTCVNPVASSSISGAIGSQEVKFTATTSIAKPTYTKSTSTSVCAPAGGPPCYTVKYTVIHKLSQSWYIWLR